MSENAVLSTVAFYLLTGSTLAAAAGVVFKKNLVHCAFLLALTFLGMAGLYLMLSAEFLAAVQVLVYSGAIAILMVIGVMLTHQDDMSRSSPSNRLKVTGFIAATAFMGTIIWAILATPWKPGTPAVVQASDLGRRFLTDFAVPFEASALLLLAALIGTVVLFKGGKA
jgi:NADH:ubiquinone oxidoreductase subunit 6 (subunit J)